MELVKNRLLWAGLVDIVVRADWVILCLWTAATNGPVFYLPDDMNMKPGRNDIDRGTTKNLERNLA
jgi:hypothetical protein